MDFDQLIVVKETREGEGRVALTPADVATLVAKKYRIMVESEAGRLAGFHDQEYINAGASIFNLNSLTISPNSLVMRVKRPTPTREALENKILPAGTTMIGFLDPFDVDHENHHSRWQALGVRTISLELLALTPDDPRNAQAAMSRFAGRLALQDALHKYRGSLPKRVSVVGTGPAGLGAAFAARDMGLPVQLFGRQERHRQAVEAAGMVYQLLPPTEQTSFIREHLSQETIVITAVRNIGETTPLLIDSDCLAVIPDHAVLVDLCTGEGGCILGSKEDAVVTIDRDISIVNVSGYPKAEPRAASEAFSQCMVNLLLQGFNTPHTETPPSPSPPAESRGQS